MTPRLPVPASAEPLEAYASAFDDLFTRRNQRQSFRRYLEGLLLSQERNKTLTALANAEPIVGAQHPNVQALQWFLAESCWEVEQINARRKQRLLCDPLTTPNPQGALVIDETGDRKEGKRTAHVGRQYLANVGKIDNGVVSVTSLYADENLYYPLEVEPYTPSSWFEKGNSDPKFRTKPQIALELVRKEVAVGTPFRAVVADSFYGENEEFRMGLQQSGIGFVLGLRRSHCWWHRVEEVGSLLEAAEAAPWERAQQPGDWHKVVRTFTDGHEEIWWALELQVKPYGPEHVLRAVVATTDPEHFPETSTWFLVTNLPAPDSPRARESPLEPAALAELVRLYGLRNWVEQSYKQVKHALGWAQYQVRSDQAIRRHWALVMCAFSFVWQERTRLGSEPALEAFLAEAEPPTANPLPERGENGSRFCWLAGMLAGGPAGGTCLAGALDSSWQALARVVRPAAA